MRLIDADALAERLKLQYGEELGWQCTVNMSDVGMMIEDAPTVDAVEVMHGEWEKHDESKDDFYHHRCSICKVDAPFNYVETEDYDEDMDGEWCFVGLRIADIVEHFTNYCPHCGAKMDGKRKDTDNE